MDSTYPLVPIANFIGSFLVLISLIGVLSHRPWNTGAFALAVNVFLKSVVVGINTIVWSNNANDVAPAWCDITSHLTVFERTSIPSCTFVITRRLFHTVRYSNSLMYVARNDKQKEATNDFLLCFGFPVIMTGLYYLVQNARYDIYEEFGCQSSVYHCGVSILFEIIGSALLPMISFFVHLPKITWTLFRRQREMAKYFDRTENTFRRDFSRPLILSFIIVPPLMLNIVLNFALYTIFVVRADQRSAIVFWPGWSKVHSTWEPNLIPASLWTKNGFLAKLVIRYLEYKNPIYACGFFAVYGLAEDARKRYRSIIWTAVEPLCLHQQPLDSKAVSSITFQSPSASLV